MAKEFQAPKEWGLSPQQDLVIGSLMDEAGKYISAGTFCDALYNEGFVKGPAPAKLRVLMQRCRAIVHDHSNGRVNIVIRRNSGWKITKKQSMVLLKIVDELN